MVVKMRGWKCPHCGNKDRGLIETNLAPDERTGSAYRRCREEETLLCMAKMKPSESTFRGDETYAETADAEGLVPCGMQWDPTDEAEET